MILSALLVSVGINFGLCVIYICLFSILRKLPVHADVYARRIVAETKNDSTLERLLPSSSWVRMAWLPTEDELLMRSGLDGFVFMRIYIFRLLTFIPYSLWNFVIVLYARNHFKLICWTNGVFGTKRLRVSSFYRLTKSSIFNKKPRLTLQIQKLCLTKRYQLPASYYPLSASFSEHAQSKVIFF